MENRPVSGKKLSFATSPHPALPHAITMLSIPPVHVKSLTVISSLPGYLPFSKLFLNLSLNPKPQLKTEHNVDRGLDPQSVPKQC